MTGNFSLREFFSFLKKKIVLFLITVIVVAAVFSTAGYRRRNELKGTPSYSFQTHSMTISEMLYFENNVSGQGTAGLTDYAGFWIRNEYLTDFVNVLDQKYDMNLVDSSWKNTAQTDRMTWVRDSFHVHAVNGQPYYEIYLILQANAGNYEYLLANMESMLMDYNTFAEGVIEEAFPGSGMTVAKLDTSTLEVASRNEDGGGRSMKWFLVLGAAGGIACAFLLILLRFLHDPKMSSFTAEADRWGIALYELDRAEDRKRLIYGMPARGEDAPIPAAVFHLEKERISMSTLLAEELSEIGMRAEETEGTGDWHHPIRIRQTMAAKKDCELLFVNERGMGAEQLPLAVESGRILILADEKTKRKELRSVLGALRQVRSSTDILLLKKGAGKR
ncbi:MAG: hypothetical protein Q4B15_01790 [Lachnospiraceae bacterium]|nr:hypothetical protein [Lachnospiraceae bacterium]